MEIQNKGFNEYCLVQFGRTLSKEELETIMNEIIIDINKLHRLSLEIREIAIGVIKKIFDAIVENKNIDIEKEFIKTTIDVIEEIGKMRAKNQEEKNFVIVICEYVKLKIG